MALAEVGFAICRRRDGSFTRGPSFSQGDHNNVAVGLQCPYDSVPFATFHTHPDGVAQPSNQDIREHQRVGLHWACISNGRELRCTYIA